MSKKLVVVVKMKDGRVLRGSYNYLHAISRKMAFQDEPSCESINLYEPGSEPIGPRGKQPTGEQDARGAGSSTQPSLSKNKGLHQPPAPFPFGLRGWSGL